MRARGTARMVAVALTGALAVGGCSLLFDGKDLRGKGGGGDMGAGGTGGTGGGGDVDMAGGGGTGGTGGGGGSASCTPLSTVKFTVAKPSVAANGPYAVAVADLDHDGKLDIVTANYNSNSFSVLLGDGKGAFALAPSTPVTTCNVPQLVVTADVTGDALPDVIISCFNANATPSPTANVDVYVNQSTPGTIKLANAKPVTLVPTALGLPYLAAGNFNGDAKTDLVLVDPNDNMARIYDGNGDGTFTAGPSHVAGSGASWTTVGNLNGDGIDDILIYNESDETMTMLTSGNTGFTSTRLAYDTTAMGGTLYFVSNPPTLVDINHDGLLDILVASGTSQTGTVEKFLNGGTATAPAFPATPADISTGDFPVAQGFADFNCDGTLDIAVSTNGCDPANAPPSCPSNMLQPPNLWILPGHGTGYDAALTTGIPLGADSLAIADVNGDGYPDIVAGAAGTTVTVLLNTP